MPKVRSVRTLLVLVTAVLWAAAAPADIVASTLVLSPGEHAAVGADGAAVGFAGIAGDSRCPCDATCFWEGDAAAGLWFRPAGGDPVAFTLHTHPAFAGAATFGVYRVVLDQVDPYPCLDDPIDPSDYLVTLTVDVLAPVGAEPVSWGALKGLYRR